jgi:hypothetical protein
VLRSGDTYEGEWLQGKMHGEGKYHYSGGDVYQGAFKEGLMHGPGCPPPACPAQLFRDLRCMLNCVCVCVCVCVCMCVTYVIICDCVMIIHMCEYCFATCDAC